MGPVRLRGADDRALVSHGCAHSHIGYTDKAIEVALIVLLLADAYLARSEPSGETSGTRTTGT